MKGQLLLEQASGHERESANTAEACFRQALEVSRAQGAKSLELRAATSLARHLKGQRRALEAQAVLKPVYDWFKEGFELPDLTDARSLLESL